LDPDRSKSRIFHLPIFQFSGRGGGGGGRREGGGGGRRDPWEEKVQIPFFTSFKTQLFQSGELTRQLIYGTPQSAAVILTFLEKKENTGSRMVAN
jgi:hypothetical protein